MKIKKMIICITLLLVLVIVYLLIGLVPNILKKKNDAASINNISMLVAHRGGAGMGYENSLQCMKLALELNVDMIEIDIHLTKDGQMIVCHDQTIDRTTNGSGRIDEMTLSELQKFRIIDSEGKATEEHLPTLEDILNLVDGKTKLLIEIKKTGNIYAGIEEKLISMLKKHNAYSWVVVQSFNDSVIEKIHNLDSTIQLEKLFIFKFPLLPLIFDGTITTFNYDKYKYINSFNIFYQAASESLINDIHSHNKEVKIWTLDGPETLPAIKVEGVISNRPDLWKNMIKPAHQ